MLTELYWTLNFEQTRDLSCSDLFLFLISFTCVITCIGCQDSLDGAQCHSVFHSDYLFLLQRAWKAEPYWSGILQTGFLTASELLQDEIILSVSAISDNAE